MQPDPNLKPRSSALATAFLLVSATLSVAILAVRNLYDDEISSLYPITISVKNILQTNALGGVHPPGMYLLAHFAYGILPSFRWMNLFPCLLLYAGLTFFLFEITPLFTRARSQFCLLLVATLHPQLLVWSTTFRWYSWWTGLALITLTPALQPRKLRPTLGVQRALTLGSLLACLFYLNYITFLFAVALGAAMLLRYRSEPWKRQLRPALLIFGVFCALIAVQIHTMITVHIPDGADQRSGVATSSIRLVQSIAASEAYLPWHPLAILADLLFAALCLCGLAALLRLNRNRYSQTLLQIDRASPLASIIVFGLLFFALVGVTGLGGKPRNGLLLIPVLAPATALIVGRLRPRLQSAILIFFALWSAVGVAHILGRQGLAKATMNDRPEQVVAFIQQTTGPDCAVVVTYDATLAFSLAQSDLPRLLIISPYVEPTFGGLRSLPHDDCAHSRLFAVHSYLWERGDWEKALNRQLQSSTQSIEGQPRTDSFSFDPDAGRKRRLSHIAWLGHDLASAGQLPDYRYVVISGAIDLASLPAMRSRMPAFAADSNSLPAN